MGQKALQLTLTNSAATPSTRGTAMSNGNVPRRRLPVDGGRRARCLSQQRRGLERSNELMMGKIAGKPFSRTLRAIISDREILQRYANLLVTEISLF